MGMVCAGWDVEKQEVEEFAGLAEWEGAATGGDKESFISHDI